MNYHLKRKQGWLLPVVAAAIFIVAGCQTIRQSSKFGLSEGWYKTKAFGDSVTRAYVLPTGEDILAFGATTSTQQQIDSTQAPRLTFALNEHSSPQRSYFFRQHSLDVDVLTIPIKYRPRVDALSNQLVTSVLNGAVYLGRRNDIYKVSYTATPFKSVRRSLTHYGLSYGIFTGVGSTVIDGGVTNGYSANTYEGFVNPTGVALILGIDNVNFGLLAGIDNLIDRNRQYWVYRGQPWFGLSVGLNLN